MAKKKILKIVVKETEEGSETNLTIEGLTDFEVVGLLSYYHDAYKVKMMRANQANEQQKDE